MSITSVVFLSLLHAAPCLEGGTGCTVQSRVGGASIKLRVDTGADLTVLSADAAVRAGIRPDRKSPVIFVRGVNGVSVAALAFAKIKVGDLEEEDVLVAVAPQLEIEGLLGMTFLERFRFKLGGKNLELEPIDKGEEKRGGRGQSWWSLRFLRNAERLLQYESMIPSAKDVDEAIAGEIGTSPDELSLTEMATRLRTLARDEADRLSTAAARASVPHEWRR